jgi:hypothetical protein
MYTGNLGGLSGADAKCQALANAAGLSGTYRAWLSDNTGSPSTRFTKHSGPYVLVNNTVIANGWNDLIKGSLVNPINLTEKNTAPPLGNTSCAGGGFPTVWTNTNTNGTMTSSSHSCSNWASTSGSSYWGKADDKSSSWTAWCSGGICSWVSPLYCFQQ